MLLLTPPATMPLCIPSLGLRRHWASRWSPARFSAVDSSDGFRGRLWKPTLRLLDRPESSDYPTVPPGDSEGDFAEPDLGCSAPVNNAPPASVLACASLIAQAAIDVLTQRFEFEDEVIDVYRPLPEAPFDHVGRYRRPIPGQT